MKLIIIDKSFIDRSEGSSEIDILSKKASLVMTDSLFYELINTSNRSLQQCFGNFPNTQNPLMIVELEKLFNFEIKNKRPFGEISKYALDITYSFNKRLREGTFIFDGEVKRAKEKWEEKTKKKTEDFIARCLSVHEFFPELNSIPWHGHDFIGEIDKVKHKVAEDEAFVSNICTNIFKNIPNSINKNWFLFQLIQCHMIYGLNYFCKWQWRAP